jgi:hypothetical protein
MNIRTVAAINGWRWIVAGMQLFRRDPAQWLLLIGTLFVASRVLFLIPLVPLLAILVAPHFLAGLAHGAQALEQHKPLRNGYLFSGFLRNAAPLAIIGGISLLGQLLTLMVIISVAGDTFNDVARNMAGGAASPESMAAVQAAAPRRMIAMLAGFSVSLPLMMATWYAPLLVFFDDVKPAAALYLSLLACVRNMMPLLVFSVALMVPMFVFTRVGLVLGQIDLGLWLLAPLIVPSIYASYRDLFVHTPAISEPPENP